MFYWELSWSTFGAEIDAARSKRTCLWKCIPPKENRHRTMTGWNPHNCQPWESTKEDAQDVQNSVTFSRIWRKSREITAVITIIEG